MRYRLAQILCALVIAAQFVSDTILEVSNEIEAKICSGHELTEAVLKTVAVKPNLLSDNVKAGLRKIPSFQG